VLTTNRQPSGRRHRRLFLHLACRLRRTSTETVLTEPPGETSAHRPGQGLPRPRPHRRPPRMGGGRGRPARRDPEHA
jgi:hypothetical protein